jgi:hypothetical protein
MIEMPCSDIRIRGKSVHVNDISRQQFSKIASRRFQRRITLTGQGLVLGAGTLLAKLDDKALPIEADQVRIWTLLTIAYGHDVALAILGSLRRVAKRWQGGDKSLAAIHLAQMGLPDIGEDAAFRMALAAELLDAGVAPRELGLNPVQFDVSKYDENQLRVPAGSGRESGQSTSGDAATAGDASSLVEGRSASANGGVHQEYTLPKDAVAVARPDGSTIYGPDSATKKLMAPPQPNFQEVYAAGERIADLSLLQQIDSARTALNNSEPMIFNGTRRQTPGFPNMSIPLITPLGSTWRAQVTGYINPSPLPKPMLSFNSSNAFDDKYKGREWKIKGWEDAHTRAWR